MSKFPCLALSALLLVGCTASAGGSITPGASTAPSAVPSGGATPKPAKPGDPVPFTHQITVKRDGAAVKVTDLGARTVVAASKLLSLSFGGPIAPKQSVGEYQFTILLQGKTKAPTEDGFTRADASLANITLLMGDNNIGTVFGPKGTPDSETLTIAGGKLSYQYKGTYADLSGKQSFACEIDVKDAPLN